MKFILLLSSYFIFILPSFAQDEEDLSFLVDSLCQIIDEDSTAKKYTFEIITYKKGFLPIKKEYEVQSKNKFITKISCSYSEFSKDTLNGYGNYWSEELYFYYGTLMRFDQSEGFYLLDTMIKPYSKRIENNFPEVFWSLHITLFKDKIIHTYSNGHGMTETDEFNLENHYRNIVFTRKKEIKTKYPHLK